MTYYDRHYLDARWLGICVTAANVFESGTFELIGVRRWRHDEQLRTRFLHRPSRRILSIVIPGGDDLRAVDDVTRQLLLQLPN